MCLCFVVNVWRYDDEHRCTRGEGQALIRWDSVQLMMLFPFHSCSQEPVTSKKRKKPYNITQKLDGFVFLTWLDALNSSTVFVLSSDLIRRTITAGLIKFVSTFTTRNVLFVSKASANFIAVRSVNPTLVSDITSKWVLLDNASNNVSNFSSEIF